MLPPIEEIGHEFVAGDPHRIYLNAGSLTRTPLSVLHWMEEKRRELQADPTLSLVQFPAALWSTHEAIAREWGTQPQDLFLRANVTHVLNDLVFALPMPERGGLFCSEYEYGATALLVEERARQLSRDFGFFPLGSAPGASDGEILEGLARWLATNRPALVVFSHVATSTGKLLPVREMSELFQRAGSRVVVDGAHGPGALPFRLEEWRGVDAYGGNLHKWFLGPWGTAFGWVNPIWKDRIPWQFGGWASREIPAGWKSISGMEWETARRALSGTVDPLPFIAIPEVFRFWDRWGRERLQKQALAAADKCLKEGEKEGWVPLILKAPTTPLACFHLPQNWPKEKNSEFLQFLWQEEMVQVMTPLASGGRSFLRLTPGLTETRIEEGVARVSRGLKRFRQKG